MYDYLLWLLLPVAAASGWLAAQRSSRRTRRSAGDSQHPQSGYFKGLNYILNEQPDKAIEVFVEMVQVDSETVETHLALGNLFRKRGEVDRAIRIHQNLIARPTLNVEQRAYALLELGQDYMSAGLLDRAENIFLELADGTNHKAVALRFLRDIYQSEKEWEKAIAVMRRMADATREHKNCVIAQYYCELAEAAQASKDVQLARRHLKQAIGVDPQCARASMLQGELEYEAGHYSNALRCYERFVAQAPLLVDEVIENIVACHQQLGSAEKLSGYLDALPEKTLGPLSRRIKSRLKAGAAPGTTASQAIYESLKVCPSLSLVASWIEQLAAERQGSGQDDMQKVQDVISRLADERDHYRCQHCGFVARSLHWLCPSCKHWDSFKPLDCASV